MTRYTLTVWYETEKTLQDFTVTPLIKIIAYANETLKGGYAIEARITDDIGNVLYHQVKE